MNAEYKRLGSVPAGLKARIEYNEKFQSGYRDPDERLDGYQLKWVGKEFAHWRAGAATEAMLYPDENHNKQAENKSSRNIFLTGDNIDCLKHLRNCYRGAVKMIYIDPPYNTGSDGFVYNDKYILDDETLITKLGYSDSEIKRLRSLEGRASHSAWLTFMYSRLRVAEELLSDDGVIFISIDDNEQANLKLLCDEIFDEGNFIGDLIRKTKSATNDAKTGLNYQHEFVLLYAKDSSKISIVGDEKDVSNYKNPDNDAAGAWVIADPSARSGSENAKFEIRNPYSGTVDLPPQGRYWAFSQKTFETWVKTGKVKFRKEVAEGQRGFIVKKYLTELKSDYKLLDSLFAVDNAYMNQVATKELNNLLADSSFIYPKPVTFIKKLMASIIPQNSAQVPIVLDFFAGSGTTAQAVMELNKEDGGKRQWILCQLDEQTKADSEARKAGYETIDQIARERIKRAAAKLEDTSGFKHFYVKEPIAATIDKITEFDPEKQGFLTEDMVSEFACPEIGASGEETILATWLAADGYKFTDEIETVDIAEYKAHSIDTRLYIIAQGWGHEQTKALLNQIGSFKRTINTLILYGYSFTLEAMCELEINIKTGLGIDSSIEIERRY